MAKPKTYSKYGHTTEGVTVAAARVAHDRAMTALVAADGNVFQYIVADYVVTIAPSLHGDNVTWLYSYTSPTKPRQDARQQQFRVTMFGLYEQAEAIRAAVRHVASIAWSHDLDDLDYLATLPQCLTPDDTDELMRGFGWQRRYKAAAEIIAGTAHDDANVIHRIASETVTIEAARVAAQNYARASEAIARAN